MSADGIVVVIMFGQFALIGGWFALVHWLDTRAKRASQRRGEGR